MFSLAPGKVKKRRVGLAGRSRGPLRDSQHRKCRKTRLGPLLNPRDVHRCTMRRACPFLWKDAGGRRQIVGDFRDDPLPHVDRVDEFAQGRKPLHESDRAGEFEAHFHLGVDLDEAGSPPVIRLPSGTMPMNAIE